MLDIHNSCCTWKTLDYSSSSLWCTTGISSWTNTFYSLHTTFIQCHSTLSSFSSNVCRWQTDLQIMQTIWNCRHNQHHRTETALLKVTNDLLSAMDEGKISVLVFLYLSVALDTIDHDIYYIVFIMHLDLETLCYLSFNHI